MSEYRNRTTGLVQSQGAWRQHYSNMSLPRVWNDSVLDALDLDPVLRSPAATTTAYQVSVRDGVEQDANGNWVEKYVARDMFADTTEDGVTTTKAEHEAAYQAGLDADAAKAARAERDKLLAECDWVVIRAKELGQDVPIDWYTYRGDLRQVPEQDGFPHTITWPTKHE